MKLNRVALARMPTNGLTEKPEFQTYFVDTHKKVNTIFESRTWQFHPYVWINKHGTYHSTSSSLSPFCPFHSISQMEYGLTDDFTSNSKTNAKQSKRSDQCFSTINQQMFVCCEFRGSHTPYLDYSLMHSTKRCLKCHTHTLLHWERRQNEIYAVCDVVIM